MNERFEWYYMGASGQMGPMSEEQLLELADSAALSRETLVWKVGMESWTLAGTVPRLAERLRPSWTPPPAPTVPSVERVASSFGGSAACPRDGAALRREKRSGVEIDFCPQCRGVWLDRGELEKILDRESDDPEWDRDRGGFEGQDDRRHGRKKKGFLGEVFDIFD